MAPTATTTEAAAAAIPDDVDAPLPGPVYASLKLTEVAVHPRNLRHELRGIPELADSIREHGVLEPLIVAPWPDTLKGTPTQRKKYILIAGHRRESASKSAKLKEVPCIIRLDLDTEAAQLTAMLVENLHRDDLSPIEEAEGYQAMLDLPDFTQARISKEVGQPTTRIRDRLKLNKLDDNVRDRVHTGQVTITDALALAEFADDPKATKSLLGKAGTAGFKFAVEEAREERKRAAAKAKKVDELSAAGVVIVASKPSGWKSVRTLFDKAPQYDDDALHAWFLKHHAKCSGAVVVDGKLNDWERPQLHYGCGEPELHPRPKVTKSKAELAAEQKEKDDQAAREIAVAAATTVRQDFLAEAIQTATPGLATALMIDAILDGPTGYESPNDTTARHAWLGHMMGKPDDLGREALAAALGKLLIAKLAVVLDLSRNFYNEVALNRSYPHASLGRDNTDWVLKVQDVYGYEWTTFERERFKSVLDPELDGVDEDDEWGGPEVSDDEIDGVPVEDHQLPPVDPHDPDAGRDDVDEDDVVSESDAPEGDA